MEVALLRSYHDRCVSLLKELDDGKADAKIELFIEKFQGTPTRQLVEEHAPFLRQCIVIRLPLNPRTFRLGFHKIDSIHSYNLSGAETLGGRLDWAASNAKTAHALWSWFLRTAKRPNTHRWDIMKGLKFLYVGNKQDDHALWKASDPTLVSHLNFPELPATR